jgi:hypothetical protein
MLQQARRLAPPMTRRWIVADMDSTLLRKELGVNGDLDNSPCRAPLFEWLQQGGSVCVVTSDDGFRPFTQMWEQIPAELRADGRVAISTSDGAALFRGGPAGEVVEDVAYWEAGAGITRGIDELMSIARDMLVAFFVDCLADRSLLAALDERRAAAYTAVLDEAVAAGGDAAAALEERLPLSRLLAPGGVTQRGTMLWRNQAGPIEQWKRTPGVKSLLASLAEVQKDARYTNLFLMGLPRVLSAPYIARFEPRLAALGYEASAAPNTVCLKNAAVSKALPVQWLSGLMEGAPEPPVLSLRHSVAFGDNPSGNDKPLTTFGDQGMPFVSVSPEQDEALPPGLVALHVGGLEHGSAAVLSRLVQNFSGGDESWCPSDGLERACGAAKAELVEREHQPKL